MTTDPVEHLESRPWPRWLGAWPLHVLLLAAVSFGVYSNAFDHSFNLDSRHVALDNPSIRSLDNVPEFFVDPGTFSTLRSNVDYRPVLQASYALDHALGGYQMRQWHTTQVLLHLVCALGLYGLCRRVLRLALGAAAPEHALVALVAALVFAAHPANAGVVDYVSARSSLLTAAFLLPAVLAYTRRMGAEAEPAGALHDARGYRRPALLAGLLYGLALFTKIEAVACLGVFFLFDVWQTALRDGGRRGFLGDVWRTLRGVAWLRLAPALVFTAGYFLVRREVMAPFEYEEARRIADVGVLDYLMTQTVALWHYVGRWFLAVELVADEALYPVSRSLAEPRVLLALGGWAVVATLLAAAWRTRPYLTVLGVSALALVSPTSSFLPLAEMVNEHRPYLPMALLSLVWTIPLGLFALRALRAPAVRLGAVLGLGVLVAGLGAGTLERNRAFLTRAAYWEDVLTKAPHHRAHVNYGLTFLEDGDHERAREHFLAALETAPYWHITHTNLGIVFDQLGDVVKAREHHDRAVDHDTFTGTALTHRGYFLLRRGEYAAAAADFRASMPRSLEHYQNWKGLAVAQAGLGDAQGCFEAIEECLAVEPERTKLDIVSVLQPYFADATRYEAGIEFLQRLDQRLPDEWWVHENIGTLATRLGRSELAAEARARAARLKGRPAVTGDAQQAPPSE